MGRKQHRMSLKRIFRRGPLLFSDFLNLASQAVHPSPRLMLRRRQRPLQPTWPSSSSNSSPPRPLMDHLTTPTPPLRQPLRLAATASRGLSLGPPGLPGHPDTSTRRPLAVIRSAESSSVRTKGRSVSFILCIYSRYQLLLLTTCRYCCCRYCRRRYHALFIHRDRDRLCYVVHHFICR